MDKKTLFKYGALGGVLLFYGLVLAPIIMKAAFNIIGATAASVVALGLGGVVVAFAPAAALALTQWKFKAIKAVVDRAPIETLYVRLQERTTALNDYRTRLQTQTTALKSYRRKALQMINDYPEDAPATKAELDKFEKLLVFRVDKYKEACAKLNIFTGIVQKAERRYEMAVASLEAGKAMEMDESFMKTLKEQFAFDKVEETVDAAFAQMDMALVDEEMAMNQIRESNSTRQINYTPSGDIDLGKILDPVAMPVIKSAANAPAAQPGYMRGLDV